MSRHEICSIPELAFKHAALGNYGETFHLSSYADEQEFIDQVLMGSPLGQALCEAFASGKHLRLYREDGSERRAERLEIVIWHQINRERQMLDEATGLVAAQTEPRRL